MKLGKKRPVAKGSNSWMMKGEHNGFQIEIHYSEQYECYSFIVCNGSDTYDSLWDSITFNNELDTISACKEYVEGL